MDAPLAQTCFRRAHAVAISLYEVYDDRSLSVITETMDQPAPRLSTLRLIQELDEDCFMDCFGLYPALTQLSISKGKIEEPISIRLPLLTHLHLCNIKIDGNLQWILGFLRYAPDLEELLFEDVEQLENQELEAASPKRNLTLPRLKKLMLDGDPLIVWGILIALCPNVAQHFQELVVRPHFPLHGTIYYSLAPDVLHHTVAHWCTATNLPLPDAQLVWTCAGNDVIVEVIIKTPADTIPILKLRTLHRDDQVPLYRKYNLKIDSIWIEHLKPDTPARPKWTTQLEDMIHDQVVELKLLTFHHCRDGIPGLESWIREKVSGGLIFQKVMFDWCYI
jgi:hypothetical protein